MNRFHFLKQTAHTFYGASAAHEVIDYYYALIFDVREDAGTTYHSTEEQVFASFGLIS